MAVSLSLIALLNFVNTQWNKVGCPFQELVVIVTGNKTSITDCICSYAVNNIDDDKLNKLIQ